MGQEIKRQERIKIDLGRCEMRNCEQPVAWLFEIGDAEPYTHGTILYVCEDHAMDTDVLFERVEHDAKAGADDELDTKIKEELNQRR